MLDHRDDVNESYTVVDFVGFLKLLKGEPLGTSRELLPQFPQGLRPPVLGPIKQDDDDPGERPGLATKVFGERERTGPILRKSGAL